MEGVAVGSTPYLYTSRHWERVLGACRHRAGEHEVCRMGMLRAFWFAGRGNRAGPFKRIFLCLAVLPAWAAHPAALISSSSSRDKAGGDGHGRAAGLGGLLAAAGLGAQNPAPALPAQPSPLPSPLPSPALRRDGE